MDILSFLLLGVSLSMDALAVSVSMGICVPDLRKREAVKIGLYFGGFQALMPTLGWLLGTSVIAYISAFDHWIAFGLLAFIGIKMVVDAVRGKEEKQACDRRGDMLSHKTLFFMAVATSIDALAVGVSLAMVKADIAIGAAVIGLTTFLLSFVGAVAGRRLGSAFEKKAMIAGGLVLVAIGAKILIEHLTGV
ncbi:manganese efflux pump MntP [Christensenella tenuis]|nr:manganese efflux pump MntP family protein [Christensenella tenuis]